MLVTTIVCFVALILDRGFSNWIRGKFSRREDAKVRQPFVLFIFVLILFCFGFGNAGNAPDFSRRTDEADEAESVKALALIPPDLVK